VTAAPLRRATREIAVFPLRVYRVLVSPLLPHSCRFAPTCSAYAVDAILLHGVLHGVALTVRRLSRCHPYCAPGVDPVPAPR